MGRDGARPFIVWHRRQALSITCTYTLTFTYTSSVRKKVLATGRIPAASRVAVFRTALTVLLCHLSFSAF